MLDGIVPAATGLTLCCHTLAVCFIIPGTKTSVGNILHNFLVKNYKPSLLPDWGEKRGF